MNRSKLFATLMVTLLFSSGCLKHMGNGKLQVLTFDLKGFNAIRVGDAFNVIVKQGAAYQVELTTDENLLGDIRLEVVSGCLDASIRGVVHTVTRLDLVVTMPDIREIRVEDAAMVSFALFTLPSLKLEVSDAGVVDGRDSLVVSAEVEQRNASTVTLSFPHQESGLLRGRLHDASTLYYYGKPARVDIDCSGASRVIQR